MKPKFNFSSLKVLFVNCTLKQSPRKSHTRALIDVSSHILKQEHVNYEVIRLVDHQVAYGVYPDMTEHGVNKDEWPSIYKKVMDADILIVGTPIWLGEKSSVATKLIERLYAMSGQLNEEGQYQFYGKVAGAIITGNEDGIKHCGMSLLYALQHIGYSIPPQADCGWIGEAGPGPSYLDEGSNAQNNDFTNRNNTFMTYNLLHLALLLKNNNGYPDYGNSRKAWDNGERWKFEKPKPQ